MLSENSFSRFLAWFSANSFLILFVLGNLTVVLCAYLMYSIEAGTNPQMGSFIDAMWWAFATVTTVGYGDITPVTLLGKAIGIFLMLGGTALVRDLYCSFCQCSFGERL